MSHEIEIDGKKYPVVDVKIEDFARSVEVTDGNSRTSISNLLDWNPKTNPTKTNPTK